MKKALLKPELEKVPRAAGHCPSPNTRGCTGLEGWFSLGRPDHQLTLKELKLGGWGGRGADMAELQGRWEGLWAGTVEDKEQ